MTFSRTAQVSATLQTRIPISSGPLCYNYLSVPHALSSSFYPAAYLCLSSLPCLLHQLAIVFRIRLLEDNDLSRQCRHYAPPTSAVRFVNLISRSPPLSKDRYSGVASYHL